MNAGSSELLDGIWDMWHILSSPRRIVLDLLYAIRATGENAGNAKGLPPAFCALVLFEALISRINL